MCFRQRAASIFSESIGILIIFAAATAHAQNAEIDRLHRNVSLAGMTYCTNYRGVWDPVIREFVLKESALIDAERATLRKIDAIGSQLNLTATDLNFLNEVADTISERGLSFPAQDAPITETLYSVMGHFVAMANRGEPITLDSIKATGFIPDPANQERVVRKANEIAQRYLKDSKDFHKTPANADTELSFEEYSFEMLNVFSAQDILNISQLGFDKSHSPSGQSVLQNNGLAKTFTTYQQRLREAKQEYGKTQLAQLKKDYALGFLSLTSHPEYFPPNPLVEGSGGLACDIESKNPSESFDDMYLSALANHGTTLFPLAEFIFENREKLKISCFKNEQGKNGKKDRLKNNPSAEMNRYPEKYEEDLDDVFENAQRKFSLMAYYSVSKTNQPAGYCEISNQIAIPRLVLSLFGLSGSLLGDLGAVAINEIAKTQLPKNDISVQCAFLTLFLEKFYLEKRK